MPVKADGTCDPVGDAGLNSYGNVCGPVGDAGLNSYGNVRGPVGDAGSFIGDGLPDVAPGVSEVSGEGVSAGHEVDVEGVVVNSQPGIDPLPADTVMNIHLFSEPLSSAVTLKQRGGSQVKRMAIPDTGAGRR